MKEEIYSILEKEGRPLGAEELSGGVNRPQKEISEALKELAREGRILMTKKGKAALPAQLGLVYGRIQRSPKGFGFFIPEGPGQDIFLAAEDLKGAMHGDMVWVRQTSEGFPGESGRGEVVLIAKRKSSRITGLFERAGRMGGYVIPDDPRIPEDLLIPAGCVRGAAQGDKVVAEITQYPSLRRSMVGRVVEVLGQAGEKGMDILSIIRRLDLPDEFGESALAQAASLKPPSAKDLEGRRDFRDMLTVTIDGADAKDLDDAVSLARGKDGGYTLWVHIADVAHYVAEGSAIDREAYRRGTSVYFPDRVLPMLPKELSNGLCSLNPNEDKLAMTCEMELNASGKVTGYHIVESVIRSDYRMTYDGVNAIFQGDKALRQKYAKAVPMLEDMRELMGILRSRRVKRGAIDFDLPEARIALDDNGVAVDVQPKARGDAEKLIEEFMLCANETVAAHGIGRSLPMLYRVHNPPDGERIRELNEFLGTFGHGIGVGESLRPAAVQRLLNAVKGTPEETVVSRVTLRAMTKAKYAPQSTGHFGLATAKYCHFTSPIRRYPDLVVHRSLKESLHRRMRGARRKGLEEFMGPAAIHCSEREIAATEAERAADSLKKCEYMSKRIGEEYDGIISGVGHNGFYVELPNTVEGMVRAASLKDDYYSLDEKNYRLVGKAAGRQFRLGDPVRVRVAAADMDTGNVEFLLCGGERPQPLPKARPPKAEDGEAKGGKDSGAKESRGRGGKSRRGKKQGRQSTRGKKDDKIFTIRSHGKGGVKGGGKKRHTQARRKP